MNNRGQAKWIALFIIFILLVAIIIFAITARMSSTSSPEGQQPSKIEYEEIHVESIQENETYQKLLDYMEQYPDTRLMLLVAYFPNMTMTQTIRERYVELAKHNYSFGLHVHIAVRPEINAVPYQDQLRIIRYGRDFLAGLNITTTYFAPGWWSYNDVTIQACHDLGLWHFSLWEPLCKNLNLEEWNMELVPVKEYTHDWEL